MNFFLLLKTKEAFFEQLLVATAPPDIIEVNVYQQTVCLPFILQNTFFCVQQKTEILTGLEQLEGE